MNNEEKSDLFVFKKMDSKSNETDDIKESFSTNTEPGFYDVQFNIPDPGSEEISKRNFETTDNKELNNNLTSGLASKQIKNSINISSKAPKIKSDRQNKKNNGKKYNISYDSKSRKVDLIIPESSIDKFSFNMLKSNTIKGTFAFKESFLDMNMVLEYDTVGYKPL
nr:hypothetical protein [Bacilli bacterium]